MEAALARTTDPVTSHEAAASINVGGESGIGVTDREQVVIDTIRSNGPMTQEQVADTTGIERPAISPRFAPLVRKGMLQIVGKGKNRSGRRAFVFGLTERVSLRQPTVV
jgi:predicted ArsR family transcriptional regulator